VAKIESLRNEFASVDVDNSGEIDAAELLNVMAAMPGCGDMTQTEAAQLIEFVDRCKKKHTHTNIQRICSADNRLLSSFKSSRCYR
jgi:Ca2+-binding EF-hand superfamily protein